ncbi:hypothetical protein C8R46DRAFT_1001880 [Mycena filopes]|nr:hypothetical protein C8R46DRAFT_1001880 [Mycena filopes]
MHRCLKIPEILQITFEELLVYEPGILQTPRVTLRPYGAEALSRLAQTCHDFSDLALDLLWKDQYTLIPLLKTFPPHVWELANPASHTATFRFRSTLNLADWKCVLKYARRIRKLTIGVVDLKLDVVELINVSLPVEHLLPNLLNLTWHPSDLQVFSHIGLFLGPGLATLDLHVEPTVVHSSFLMGLASKHPSLTDLTLRWYGVDDPTLDAMSALVSALPQLQRLSVPRLNASAYKSLAALPTLRHFALEDLESFPAERETRPHPRFPALTSLEIRSSQFTRASPALVATLSNTPLRVFRCESETNPTMQDMRQLLVALGEGCSHPHLQEIFIDLGIDDTSAEITTSAVFTPLLPFSNLRQVIIASGFDLALDDAFCTALAPAWPRIEILDITTNLVGPRRPSTVGLLTLTAFARHCPRLAELSLEVDAQGLPDGPYPPPPERRVSQTVLHRLAVGYSPIDSPFFAARFLSMVFPALQTVTSSAPRDGPETEEGRAKWAEAAKLLPMFAAIRLEEKMYWGRAGTV